MKPTTTISTNDARTLVNALRPFRAQYPEGSKAYAEMTVLMVKLVEASDPDHQPDTTDPVEPEENKILDELHRAICLIGIITDRDGHDLIRRDSVFDIIDQRRFKR